MKPTLNKDMLGVVAIIRLYHGDSSSFLVKQNLEVFDSFGGLDNSTCFSPESLEVWCPWPQGSDAQS